MTNKTKLKITWIFTLIICALCSIYIIKYKETERALLVTENELNIVQDGLAEQIDNNDVLKQELERVNQTLEDLKSEEYEFMYLGNYKLTAYCACEICCDMYAYNRPKDANGNPIVYTASGAIAQEGRTIGVDPKIIPYGTEVYISGLGWKTAQDTGGSIGSQHIDVYMDSHESALSSGLTYGDVWVLVEKER